MIKVLKVTGDSLAPDYQEGDFVVALKIPFLFKSITPGDTVVFRNAVYGTMIKRVERIDPTSGDLYVLGTHPNSVDSRQFGALGQADLVGKVIWHIRKPR
jgi:signal peptidase I